MLRKLLIAIVLLFAFVGASIVCVAARIILTWDPSTSSFTVVKTHSRTVTPSRLVSQKDPNACTRVTVNELPSSSDEDVFLYTRMVGSGHEMIVMLSRTHLCEDGEKMDESQPCIAGVVTFDNTIDSLTAYQVRRAFYQKSGQLLSSDLSVDRQEAFLRFFEQSEVLTLFKERTKSDVCILAEYLNVQSLPPTSDSSPFFLSDPKQQIPL